MSNQSETTQNSLEEDVELEDLIWNLMNKTGFLSEVKGKIAKFIHENGCPIGDGYTVNSTRANPRTMSLIYEYLQWVGMKNTCSLLLTESPIEFDTDENRVGNPPKLVRLLNTSLILNENGGVKDKSLNGIFDSSKNATYVVKQDEKTKETSVLSEISSKSLISHNSDEDDEETSEKSVSSVKFEEIKEKDQKTETETEDEENKADEENKENVEETESVDKEKDDEDDIEMESISELMNDLDSISENTIDVSVADDSKAGESSLDHLIKLK